MHRPAPGYRSPVRDDLHLPAPCAPTPCRYRARATSLEPGLRERQGTQRGEPPIPQGQDLQGDRGRQGDPRSQANGGAKYAQDQVAVLAPGGIILAAPGQADLVEAAG